MNPILRWLPRSLIGRVFALYCANLLLFVGGGLALLCQHQYAREIERVQQHAISMSAMLVPVLTRQAARADPEGMRRTLERATRHTDFASATFVGSQDGRLEAERAAPQSARPPVWLRQAVAARLPEIQSPIATAGHDHGVLLLRFDTERIAGTLWQQAVYALWLSAAALTGGLLVIRVLLVRWLGSIEDIRSLEARMHAGADMAPAPALASDTPLELRQTYDVLNRAAQTMQAEREQAAVTLGAIADAVFTLDAQGRVVYANAAVEAVFGQWAQSFLGLHLRDVLPELVLGDRLEPWHGRHARHSSLGGREVVVDTTLSAIAGPAGGGAMGFVLACRDVTETHALNQRLRSEMRSRESALNALRRVLEGLRPPGAVRPVDGADDIEAITQLISELVLQLQERGEQLAAIFDLSPDGFVSFDAQRTVSYVSPTFTRLTGLSPLQVIGLDEAGFASALQALCVDPGQGQRSFDSLHLRADASDHREVLELGRPARRMLELGLRKSSSRAISQVLYLRDVTHETEVDRMKSEFLSTAAHELRTPMASIYGFSELMMHRQMSPERQRQLIETVHRQTEQMITIVDELLDLARIEARRGKDFVIEDIRLQDLVAGIVRDFKPPAQRPGPVMGADPGDLWVRADRSKTIQAIANVLSNAYKYSPAGGDVRLRLVLREADGERGPQAGIELEDQGLGMTPEQLARIGERFYRADTSGRIPGTGLGMSIVKEVMALQGGSLELHSEHGRGTRVSLWLPALAAVPDAIAALSSS